MKKILWTSVFWISILILFLFYLKLFDSGIAQDVANVFSVKQSVVPVQTGAQLPSTISDTLMAISTQIDLAAKKIMDMKAQEIESAASQEVSTSTPTVVKLYYFNEKEDKLLPPAQQASPQSLYPVFRTVPATDNIIRDALSLLLQGALTDSEFKDGFTSSFVRVVRLANVQLDRDGNLALSFERAPGASIGGSAFVAILTNSLIKTALQFPQVKSVALLPEELFQP